MSEMNIEVDKHDNVIGLRPREDFYTGKYIHRCASLILLNSKNEILIQNRSPTKKWSPNLYTASVSGTVADETYEECIKKEMKEEIGISIPAKFLFKFPLFLEHTKTFHAVFIGRSDKKITFDKNEISSVRWISLDKLEKELEKEPKKFSPAFLKVMKIFFEKHQQL